MEKIFMISVVIEAFKKSVMHVILYTFGKLLFGIQRLGFISGLHGSAARLDGIHPVQIHLIGIRESAPDHRRVHNKQVYMNLLSGAEI